MKKLSLKDLRVFQVLLRGYGITRAARGLETTQPKVSEVTSGTEATFESGPKGIRLVRLLAKLRPVEAYDAIPSATMRRKHEGDEPMSCCLRHFDPSVRGRGC